MKKITVSSVVTTSLLAIGFLAEASSALAVKVYPGDITTGAPPALFDISVQPVFEQINSTNAILILGAIVIVVLGIIFFAYKIYKKRRLEKIREINGTK